MQSPLKVIYSCDVNKVLKFRLREGELYSIIIVDNAPKDNNGSHELQGIKRIEIEQISSESERIICEKEYINGIAGLSHNFNSPTWWANPVSEKNEHTSKHYSNLCLFYRLVKTLRKYAENDMNIFIVCSANMFMQLECYCRDNHVKIKSLENASILWSTELNRRFWVAFKIIISITVVLIRKLYISFVLKDRIREITNSAGKIYVIRTWLDRRSFSGEGVYLDSYFGKLRGYAGSYGFNTIVLAGILDSFKEIIRNIKNSKRVQIIPEESFLNWLDFPRALLYLQTKVTLKEKVFFNGVDVTLLYKKEIESGYLSPAFFRNIFRYFIARRFALAIRFEAYIQTFENYAWEKLMILGLREEKTIGKILGFQHAFISRNSFKYFPGHRENTIMPLPDKIITMGKVTKDIMSKYGNYDAGSLQEGCALRQEYLHELRPFRRRRFNRILVPLTMVSSESVLIMNLLYQSRLPQADITVLIRCHPAAPFERYKKNIDFTIPNNFIIDNQKNIGEELSRTDMVLYTWTTVAIEALKLGLPIIYLDILDPMYVDPLFECESLKSKIRTKEELMPAIENFYNMDDSVFYSEQQKAHDYLTDYFYPVTGNNLKPFFNHSVRKT